MTATSSWRCPALLAAAVLAATCYRPRAVDCVLACDVGGRCPRNMTCSAGLCSAGPACLVKAVAAGEAHSCALIGGRVKCWGRNASGQLGVPDSADRGGSADEMGDRLPWAGLGAGRIAVALALGGQHSCALLDGGAIKCWGSNRSGQLGQGQLSDSLFAGDDDGLPPINLGQGRTAVAVAAGLYHTCAILDSGAVKCWGDNRFGQLGIGARGDRGAARDDMGDQLPVVDLGAPLPVAAIAAGAYHTCVVLAETGAVKCWGWNEYGQLGAGDARNRGLDAADMGAALPAVDLGAGRKAARLAAGAFHTCALLADSGEVKCWGLDSAGQLGVVPGTALQRGISPGDLGDRLPVVDLGARQTALAITAGASHTCALLGDASIRCWGLNFSGELGTGDHINRGDSVEYPLGDGLPLVSLGNPAIGATSVAAGANHTCAVQSAFVKCWGLNTYGRLGVGDLKQHSDASAVLLGSGG